MEDKILKVNIDSLKETNNEILKHGNNILNELDQILNNLQELDEYFESDVAKEYKELFNKHLSKTNDCFRSRNDYINNRLNEISAMYWDLHSEIGGSVSGKTEEKNG